MKHDSRYKKNTRIKQKLQEAEERETDTCEYTYCTQYC